jgi:hypothetical protein
VKRIHDLIAPPDPTLHRDNTRPAAVAPRRARQARRAIRIASVAFRRWIARCHPQHDPDALVGLAPRTLARWQRRWNDSKLNTAPRGRPLRTTHVTDRNQVIHLLDALGPHVGCATLELFFPLMSRRQLRRLLQRYRRVWRKRDRLRLHQLRWHRAGAVWAIDYTKPPAPIDNIYSSILVVRDLASGYQLLALPTTDQSAKTACDAIVPLFQQFGPPIVLKSDNVPFRAAEFTELLDRWRVCHLPSPPRTPNYNGAAEAGIGSIKTRAHHIAAHHGRTGQWTCDDVEAARLLANATARPWGHAAPTPQTAWRRREPINPAEPNRFRDTLHRFQLALDSATQRSAHTSHSSATQPTAPPHADAKPKNSDPTPPHHAPTGIQSQHADTQQPGAPCSPTLCPGRAAEHAMSNAQDHYPAPQPGEPSAPRTPDAALFHRIAIRRALVARGLLTLSTPRRITPPISTQKVARIT